MSQASEKRTYVNGCGYESVSLAARKYDIHRVLAELYIPNPYNKPCVNHKDGNKLNNDLSNLEWVTYSENNIHALQHGLRKPPTGPRPWCWRAIEAIDKNGNVRCYRSLTEAAEKTGSLVSTIYKCLSGKRKQNYGWVWRYSDV